MPTAVEKGISLDFPTGWEVVKYDGDTQADNASFYRQRIEHKVQHVRGVDVVAYATAPTERLLLIEIKDYRTGSAPAEHRVAALRQTVLQKALNTLSGLYAAVRVQDTELQLVVNWRRLRLPVQVVLFLERPPLPVAPTDTAQKFRRQNPQSAAENLFLDLTADLAALGLDFILRSTTTMQPHDGWTGRLVISAT
ncbi:hypothetical protein Q5H93_19780 [Hymenobacter sp. ASUV-10]|uniref:Class I SAM-dependent DNA methyltransferase n=1 Tax=Hymenobacter aranciens TaxID=3063996 RepID=A0ABT9BFF1_9BACT|nr:hypothetical protein [Hymenobacter sp. ASUV-10]MDO7876996.1 hypothetical protein [Hymenobacter sp. ASUV-10]